MRFLGHRDEQDETIDPRKGLDPPLNVGREPLEALVQPITARGTRSLDIPCPLPEALETELVGDLRGVHGIGQILLVGKDKEERITELVLVKHALELLACLGDTFSVIRVNNKDDALRVLEVMSPEGADLVLSSYVPDGEGDVLVLDGLNVEADCGDGGDDLAKLKLVENGGLTSGVETNHQNSHFFLA